MRTGRYYALWTPRSALELWESVVAQVPNRSQRTKSGFTSVLTCSQQIAQPFVVSLTCRQLAAEKSWQTRFRATVPKKRKRHRRVEAEPHGKLAMTRLIEGRSQQKNQVGSRDLHITARLAMRRPDINCVAKRSIIPQDLPNTTQHRTPQFIHGETRARQTCL